MNSSKPHIIPYSERAILIRWAPQIEPHLLFVILAIKSTLAEYYLKEEVEIISTYHEILLHFKTSHSNLQAEVNRLQKIVVMPFPTTSFPSTLYHLPVCYEEKYGLDLKLLKNEKGLTREKIARLHTAPTYLLFFIGFLPGFLYLGGLDPLLHVARKEVPLKKIPKGAVAIGEKQTGIYPQSSPGGWQIIGNCPVPLFTLHHDPPCIFKPGDRIKFHAISQEEHQHIVHQVAGGSYHLKKETYGN